MGGEQQVDVDRLLREGRAKAAVEDAKQEQFKVLSAVSERAIRPLFDKHGRDFDAVQREPAWRTYITVMEGLRDSREPLTPEQLDRARRTLEAL